MNLKKENVEVLNHTDGCDYSEVRFDYNGFHISIEITNDIVGSNPVSVFVKNEKIKDAVAIDFSIKNNQMKMQISDNEQTEKTKSRSLKEWRHLEQLEKSLKVIGDFFKR